MGMAIVFVRRLWGVESLSQAFGLVAPIFFDSWVREGKGEHTKRCGGGEDDNQTHLRSPGGAWALKVNADVLIYCLETAYWAGVWEKSRATLRDERAIKRGAALTRLLLDWRNGRSSALAGHGAPATAVRLSLVNLNAQAGEEIRRDA